MWVNPEKHEVERMAGVAVVDGGADFVGSGNEIEACPGCGDVLCV